MLSVKVNGIKNILRISNNNYLHFTSHITYQFKFAYFLENHTNFLHAFLIRL